MFDSLIKSIISYRGEDKKDVGLKGETIVSNNVKTLVVGKKITDVKLDKVSGSSLTPKGFNDALEQIKTLAKA